MGFSNRTRWKATFLRYPLEVASAASDEPRPICAKNTNLEWRFRRVAAPFIQSLDPEHREVAFGFRVQSLIFDLGLPRSFFGWPP